ncbi:MAG: hypothetical protein SGARI_004260, partial [Bacillariaceae sp.]
MNDTEWDIVNVLQSTSLGDDEDISENEGTDEEKHAPACTTRELCKSRRVLKGRVMDINRQLKQDPSSESVKELQKSRRSLRGKLVTINLQLKQDWQRKKSIMELRKTRQASKREWMTSKRQLAKKWQGKKRNAKMELREKRVAFKKARIEFRQEHQAYKQERHALREEWLAKKQALNKAFQQQQKEND